MPDSLGALMLTLALGGIVVFGVGAGTAWWWAIGTIVASGARMEEPLELLPDPDLRAILRRLVKPIQAL